MQHSSHHYSDDNSDILQEDDIIQDVRVQFEKKFQFLPSSCKTALPPLDTLYRCPAYSVPALQEQKRLLNAVKNRLNDVEIRDWQRHTRRRSSLLPILNELRYRIRAEFVTQAFTKLYECLFEYELVSLELEQLYSVHICEAPGAFVTGMNHYIRLNCRPRTRWEWFACTLNPYYEGNCPGNMIPDDRFILHTLPSWCFGVDGTGDIMVRENRDAIIQRSKLWPAVHLVTADGSVDCLNVPEEQEERVAKLHFAETVLALSILTAGGNFVLKMFTLFEHTSVSLLFLLNHCFNELHVFKPCTSKPGNSEVYLIAKYYRKPAGIEQFLEAINSNLESSSYSMFDPSTIPEAFLHELRSCCSNFVRWQMEVIENNIRFYGAKNPVEYRRLIAFKQTIMEMFFERYRITPIRATERIVRGINVSGEPNINQKESHGSYNDRLLSAVAVSSLMEKLRSLRNCLDLLTLTRQIFHPKTQLGDLPLKTTPENGLTLDQELLFAVGKSIERVKYSKFALITCIRLLNDTSDLFRKMIGTPSSSNNHVLPMQKNIISVDIRSYAMVTNADRHEKQLYHTIVRKILAMVQKAGGSSIETVGHINDELILENWLLLTQFSVGFLYLLKLFVFETIEQYSPTRIALRRFQPDGIKNLISLNDAFESACCSASGLPAGASKSILALVPITSLLDGGFQYAILNYNNSLCLMYCARLLDELEKLTTHD